MAINGNKKPHWVSGNGIWPLVMEEGKSETNTLAVKTKYFSLIAEAWFCLRLIPMSQGERQGANIQ